MPKTRKNAAVNSQQIELVSVREVAETLNVNRMTVYRMLDQKILPRVDVLGVVRIPMDRVRAFIDDQIRAAT